MKFDIEIDEKSGFCYGVVRAIEQIEEILGKEKKLICLGAVVHNDSEIQRLSDKGLEIIDSLEDIEERKVLIRAHGEPPHIYELAKKNKLEIIDCTCPVVLKLQKRIKSRYEEIKDNGGQILIFGKLGHAEVNGLVGQINSDAIVIESVGDLDNPLIFKKINYSDMISLFSQTTKDPNEYNALSEEIKKRIYGVGGKIQDYKVYQTICSQVSSRRPHLEKFSKNKDIIIFISGKSSSNGKVLYKICKETNSRSYKIEEPEDILKEWFKEGDKIGICGATSTPKWQLNRVAEYISLFY